MTLSVPPGTRASRQVTRDALELYVALGRGDFAALIAVLHELHDLSDVGDLTAATEAVERLQAAVLGEGLLPLRSTHVARSVQRAAFLLARYPTDERTLIEGVSLDPAVTGFYVASYRELPHLESGGETPNRAAHFLTER